VRDIRQSECHEKKSVTNGKLLLIVTAFRNRVFQNRLCVPTSVCLMMLVVIGRAAGCSDNSSVYLSVPSVPRCPRQSWLVMTLFFIYMFVTAIMLINLLIAIFR